MDAKQKQGYIIHFGYVVALVSAIVLGYFLFQDGAPIGLILSMSLAAWAGGIFFLLIQQRRASGRR